MGGGRHMDWPVGSEGVDIEAWAESAAHIYWWPLLAWAVGVVILLFLAVLITSSPVRRRFWCEEAGREVDVAFEEDGPPALRRYIAVVSCTAFSPSTLVQCHRACLDRDPPHSGDPATAACALIRHNRDPLRSMAERRS
jgi:hypothetical protein